MERRENEMKTIIIKESSFQKLFENDDTFETFYEETLKFLRGILKDPIGML